MMPKSNVLVVTQVIGAVALVAIIGVAAIQRSHGDVHEHMPLTITERDPLAQELLKCRALSTKAADDKTCEAAWAESRRRFFEMDSKKAAETQSKEHQQP
jgi:conjugative transfer region protein TrbK